MASRTRGSKWWTGALVAPCLVVAAGCNLLTGADELTIDGRQRTSDDGAGGGAAAGGQTNGNGNGATGPATNAASNGSGANATTGMPETLGDARGVTITDISFYQGIKSQVMDGGQAQNPRSPVVANRPALVRVFTTTSGASGSPITARLTIGQNPPLEVSAQPSNSSETNGDSTINFDVPAAQIQKGAGFRVELLEPVATSMPNGGAHYPSDGQAPLNAHAGHPVKVTLIPVRWGADGSNREPDTSAGTIAVYRDQLMKWYPASEAIVTVGAAITWNQDVDSSGNGWGELLDNVSQRRSNANVDVDEFYYGVFNPTSNVNNFCGGGCVAGLGNIGDPQGDYSHAAIGLGYGGDFSAEILGHEVGHNHGRPHSPCGGAAGADPGYPNSNGDIAEWGFNILTSELYGPNDFKDFMGYCQPQWVSYYTYNQLLEFKEAMQGAAVVVPPELENQAYEKIIVQPDGAKIVEDVILRRPPMSLPIDVAIKTATGSSTVHGNLVRWDHLDGGVLFVKKGAARIEEATFDLQPTRPLAPVRRVRAIRTLDH